MAFPKGEAIESLRVSAGLKRRELAQLVGLDYKTIYGIERGHSFAKRPTYARESLVRIANVLNVALADVMEVDRKDPPRPVAPPRPTKPPTRTPTAPKKERAA